MRGRKYGRGGLHANRLSRDSVVIIKGMLIDGIPIDQIARAFSVTYPCIHSIFIGRTWTHVKVER